ncbi:MAG: DUF1700 domain-containing protein [Clostridia bacterium]|nr:DUF1700 domain-containing protein [Clostridia bacterium]
MTKIKFILELRDRLSHLPQDDVEERLGFYSEMIEDRIEEGLSEEEAVSEVGSVEEIAAQIIAELPQYKNTKKKTNTKKRLSAWMIVLLVLGSPIWLSLLIAAFAVMISLYISLCSLIISLWAVFASVIGCTLYFTVAGLGFAILGNSLTGIAMLGAASICVGISILLFYSCKSASKGTVGLARKLVIFTKSCFMRKETL